jgi:hypothetical protein
MAGLLAAGGTALLLKALSPPATSCAPMAGLSLHVQADARDGGYLLDTPGTDGYFRHAVFDLIQGRIRYFETTEAPGRFLRYEFAPLHSSRCIERRVVDEFLAALPMPAGRCVAIRRISRSTSRYAVEGYARDPRKPLESVVVRDRQSGAVLAEYRSKAGSRLPGFLRRDSACARQSRATGHPARNISSFVFRDRWGGVVDAKDPALTAFATGDPGNAPDLLPPSGQVRFRLAQDGNLGPSTCWLPGWSGETEVHEITLERGPLEIDARLDPANSKAGVVLLDVHTPDKAVIILARARGPTVWHVHESSRSSAVAVLVQGVGGQAVVGLTRHTRILMSTRQHNPQANCSAEELQQIEKQVVAHYGIKSRQYQSPRQQPPVVRYGIGEPMPDGGELFHHDRALADFEVRDD